MSELNILSREDWSAPALIHEFIPVQSPVVYVICMNTHSESCQNYIDCSEMVHHLNHLHTYVNHHASIRYNFVIGGDGNIYEGRGWGVQALLPLKLTSYNNKSLVIGFIGKFTEETLPAIMGRRREELVEYGIKNKFISENFQPIQIFDKNSIR